MKGNFISSIFQAIKNFTSIITQQGRAQLDCYSKKGGKIDGDVTITGKLGIGTDKPDAKLHIISSSSTCVLKVSSKIGDNEHSFNIIPDTQSNKFTTTCPQYSFDKKVTIGALELSEVINTTENLRLQTNGSNKVVINNETGNIGIGTDNPDAKLHVLAPKSVTALIISKQIQQSTKKLLTLDTPDDNNVHFETDFDAYFFNKDITVNNINVKAGAINSLAPLVLQITSNTQTQNKSIVLDTNGNVGIGTNKPDYKLQVEGNVRFNGDALYQGSQLIISSVETKENITQLSSQEATIILKGLNPVKFSNKEDLNPRIYAGFIAEDVPDIISTDDRTAIRPIEIIAILTQKVKDHERQIASLIDTIKNQEKLVKELLDRINQV